MKSTFRNKRQPQSFALSIICLLFAACCGSAVRAAHDLPEHAIKVIYPKNGQHVAAVDSTFILGHVQSLFPGPEWLLYINGCPVPVHRDGGFLAFLPVAPGEFNFVLEATWAGSIDPNLQHRQKDPYLDESPLLTIGDTLLVRIPEPRTSLPLDSLDIGTDYERPQGDLEIISGDRLQVSFQATPHCRAWFEVPGVADSVPMVEMAPQPQAYWGEAVFGAGAVPESLLIKGIYSGFYEVRPNDFSDTVTINYFLARPDLSKIRHMILLGIADDDDSTIAKLLSLPDTVISSQSSYYVSVNSPRYPFPVRFTDSVQVVRLEPRKGYLATFQPEGVEALAIGREGDWYRVELSQSHEGWVHRESVMPLSKGILPPRSYVRSVRTYNYPDQLVVAVPLAGKHPFRVVEEDPRTVRLQLFGVTSDTDWIRYDTNDELVKLITWTQPQPGLYELTITLTQDIWGYDTYYEGATFNLQLNRPPEDVHSLRGKTVVVDPGHSHDPGAIGPTGMTEAEANLMISHTLRRVLEAEGAQVVMTRWDSSHVELYDRPAIAKAGDADLFISIHNNALPDGVNPFANNGTSSYYYQPHSINLARAIHKRMVAETGLLDHGLFHGNLAVIRPTQYPAVLVECAFMLIPEQEADLKTGRFQSVIAHAITEGIKEFLEQYDR